LYDLPCEHSVHSIFSKFLSQNKNELNNITIEGMKSYFDILMSKSILYKNERIQYVENIEKQKKNPLELYGVEHLLRYLIKLPKVLENQISTSAMENVNMVIDELFHFIEKNY
jgi:hypothetical protein